jgi:polygalacturonase
MAVNDDAVVLKGGKGPYADRDSTNGSNERIIIEDCEYGFCHGCLTCGSESVHNRNIILRHIRVNKAARLLWLKMRPDTPQHYEHICVEDVEGSVTHFLYVYPWTQFFDLQDRKDMPISYADHITMRRCKMSCDYFLNIASSDQYQLSDFTFSHLEIQAKNSCMDKVVAINGSTFQKVNIKI